MREFAPLRSRKLFRVGLTVGIALALGFAGWNSERPQTTRAATQVRISRAEFGSLIDRLSEPEGYFDTDNFISNETSYLHVIPILQERASPGGVYFGVGPDQNFSYIVHSEPSLAIIADIRRQNMLQHLLFKVLIESAQDRYDFLCTLFSRNCQELPSEAGFGEMLFHVRMSGSDPVLFERNLKEVQRALVEDYALSLSDQDLAQIEHVYRTFFREALNLRFSSFGRPSSRYPTLSELILETDREGQFQNYLSDEARFEWLQQFQRENRLIPIVGDFAGSQALRAAAEFLEEEGFEVSVFYTSNVEFYLFDLPGWQDYVANVRAFPMAEGALFIRSYFPTFGRSHPLNVPGHRPTSLIQSVAGFLEDAATGRLRSYWDVVSRNIVSE